MFTWIGALAANQPPGLPLLLTSPHSGEQVPPEAAWLAPHAKDLLLTDVDRFVDELYRGATESLNLSLLATHIHRYAADLNRYPDDVDADSVEGAPHPAGTHAKGFHWVKTTHGARLMARPLSRALHAELVQKYHDGFHTRFAAGLAQTHSTFPGRDLYHLDCHSMPSVGTGAHQDAGKTRPHVVISDFNGKAASPEFKDLVLAAFEQLGFQTSYNWPYQGGRLTQRYGQPQHGHHTLQIELNRALYMDERTREKLPAFPAVSARLTQAVALIAKSLR